MKLPFVPSRRVNKILCLVLLSVALGVLLIAGTYALMGRRDICAALCITAAIFGCFGLLYGILWSVYARKEQKRQKILEEEAQLFPESSDNSVTYHDFTLPRQELIGASRRRLQKLILWLSVSGAAAFAVLYGILCLVNGYGGIGHLVSVIVFCLLTVTPGMVMQYIIYRKYARTVPERIMLYPNKIIVDGKQYFAHEISKITVSSFDSAGKDSSVLYRKLRVNTKEQTREYTIDYRFASEETPRWSEYGEFLAALSIWANQNQVRLTVDYMN